MKNKIDTKIYALVLQKDNSLKRVLLSDLKNGLTYNKKYDTVNNINKEKTL
jgi:hypothetical protein